MAQCIVCVRVCVLSSRLPQIESISRIQHYLWMFALASVVLNENRKSCIYQLKVNRFSHCYFSVVFSFYTLLFCLTTQAHTHIRGYGQFMIKYNTMNQHKMHIKYK